MDAVQKKLLRQNPEKLTISVCWDGEAAMMRQWCPDYVIAKGRSRGKPFVITAVRDYDCLSLDDPVRDWVESHARELVVLAREGEG